MHLTFRIIYVCYYIKQICFISSSVLYHSMKFIHLEMQLSIVLEETFFGTNYKTTLQCVNYSMFCSNLNLYFNLYDPLYFLTVSCTNYLACYLLLRWRHKCTNLLLILYKWCAPHVHIKCALCNLKFCLHCRKN